MQRLAITGLVLVAISIVLLLGVRPARLFGMEALVPSDVVAVAIVSSPPPDLDFLKDVRLKRWVDVDVAALRNKVSPEFRNEIGAMLQQDLDTAWIMIHGLEKHETAWRPAFTLALIPRPFHGELLELRIQLLALRLFKVDELSIAEQGNFRIYRGRAPQQALYQLRMPGFLLVSNSREGLNKTIATYLGQAPSLAQLQSFRRVRARLPVRSGLFVYVNTGQILPLLPEFGYLLEWREGRVVDRFYAVPKN